MKFTCDGMITKWIFGTYGYGRLYAEFQLWRSNNTAFYNKVAGTIINTTVTENWLSNIHEHQSNVEFKSGDTLGIFMQPINNYYTGLGAECLSGYKTYYLQTDHSLSLNSTNSGENNQLDKCRPLVTVEIAKKVNHKQLFLVYILALIVLFLQLNLSLAHTTATIHFSSFYATATITSHTTATTSITTARTIHTSHTIARTGLSTYTQSLSPSSTNTSTGGSRSSVSVGVVGVVVLLLLVLVLTGVSVSVYVWRRKRKRKRKVSATPAQTDIHLDNPVYEGA